MSPVLVMVPSLVMPLLPPEFDIVMVPELSMVPKLKIEPVDVISMVPVAVFVRVSPLLIVRIPFMVTVLVDSLVKEPPAIISVEPFSIVKVPEVSVNGISSVTITDPSMIIVLVPAGVTPPLQFEPTDQSPVAPPTQVLVGGPDRTTTTESDIPKDSSATLVICASRLTPSKLFPSPPSPTTKSIVSPLFNDKPVAKLAKSAFPRNIGPKIVTPLCRR